jgi:hypothetical protein
MCFGSVVTSVPAFNKRTVSCIQSLQISAWTLQQQYPSESGYDYDNCTVYSKASRGRDPVATKKTSTASAIIVATEIAIGPFFRFGDILITCSASIIRWRKNIKKGV